MAARVPHADESQHSGERRQSSGHSGEPERPLVAGCVSFHWQAGPGGYEVAPGLLIPADRVRSWTCPACRLTYVGTFGQIIDQMRVVVLQTTQGRHVWHGCCACQEWPIAERMP